MSKPPSPKRVKLAELPDAIDDAHNSQAATLVPSNVEEVHLSAEVLTSQKEKHAADEPVEQWVTLKFSHAGVEHVIELAESDRWVARELNVPLLKAYLWTLRVFDLKDKLYGLTLVPFDRQKILGLVKGKLPSDEATM
jgi:ubiquitin-like domain-containing CTD phosphatase 1